MLFYYVCVRVTSNSGECSGKYSAEICHGAWKSNRSIKLVKSTYASQWNFLHARFCIVLLQGYCVISRPCYLLGLFVEIIRHCSIGNRAF